MIYDIVIIGAGPSGLSVAIEAQKAGLQYCVIEKGGIVNSIQHFPTEMSFFSTPELLEIGNVPFTSAQMRPTRAEGLEYYTRVAQFYKLNLKLFEKIFSVQDRGSNFLVQTSKGEYAAKNVVLATGYFDHPNELHIPGEHLSKVSHYYTEPYAFYRQNVLIIGAKNSAAIAALELFRHGANVTMIHRGDKLSEKIKYWILPDIENRIKEGTVKIHFKTEAVEIKQESVLLRSFSGEKFELENNFVFALTGYHPDFDFLKGIGLELDEQTMAPIHDPATFETHRKRIYVAGSLVSGKNNNQIFIENGKLHGKIIVDAILHSR